MPSSNKVINQRFMFFFHKRNHQISQAFGYHLLDTGIIWSLLASITS